MLCKSNLYKNFDIFKMVWPKYLEFILVITVSVLDAKNSPRSLHQRGVSVRLNGTVQVGVNEASSQPISGTSLKSITVQATELRLQDESGNTLHARRAITSRQHLRNNREIGTDLSGSRRRKRHRPTSQLSVHLCQRHDLFVDVDQLGWSDTVIYPRRFNVHYCAGRCTLVTRTPGVDISNHAVLRAIAGRRWRRRASPPWPCCVATSLRSTNLLYRDKQRGHYDIWQLNDAVVHTCGCR